MPFWMVSDLPELSIMNSLIRGVQATSPCRIGLQILCHLSGTLDDVALERAVQMFASE